MGLTMLDAPSGNQNWDVLTQEFRLESIAIGHFEHRLQFWSLRHAAGIPFEKLTNDAKSRIQEISVAEAAQRQSQGAILIDVREAEEFAKGHAQGALPLSKGMIEVKIEQHVPDLATAIVCYCGGG